MGMRIVSSNEQRPIRRTRRSLLALEREKSRNHGSRLRRLKAVSRSSRGQSRPSRRRRRGRFGRVEEAGDETVRQTYRESLEEIDGKIEELEGEIQEQVEENQNLGGRVSLLRTIPGVGLQTAAIVVSEPRSLGRVESAREAAAYAGVVPSHHESGTSVRGRPRMSKVGNARLRRALYFPAMSALQCNSAVKAFGDRLKERGKKKMVVLGAAMRKLLHICYGVLKSGHAFDPSLDPGT